MDIFLHFSLNGKSSGLLKTVMHSSVDIKKPYLVHTHAYLDIIEAEAESIP